MFYYTLEDATSVNLDEEAYLSANPDVAAAGLTATHHFTTYGKHEGRKQYSPQYLRAVSAYRKAKFLLFRDILDLPYNDLLCSTFPILAGQGHLSINQYTAESAGHGFGPFEEKIEHNPDLRYLDIGCGFRNRVFSNCLYLEVYPSRTADIVVEPTCRYPIKTSSLDGIGCFAVLEHTRQPWLVVQEMYRMLKPGGVVYIDWPFLQPVHGYPSHYFNATREGLTSLFEDTGFRISRAETGAHQSPAWTVEWILRDLLAALPNGPTKDSLSSMTVKELAGTYALSDIWNKAVSELSDSDVSRFACGNWIEAIKA